MNNNVTRGIIKAELLQVDILDLISIYGALDVQYINAQARYATLKAGYVFPVYSTEKSVYQYWKDISNDLQEIENLDWAEFDHIYQGFNGQEYVSIYDGVHTLYDFETNLVTVLYSPYTVDVSRHSLYQDAGNLESAGTVLDISNTVLVTSYTVPDEWFILY